MIWRPVGKWDDVKNKYIPSMGIPINYSIIKDLLDVDVPSLVKEYLESPRMVCSDQEGIDFTASILLFTTMTQEIAASAGVSSVQSPLQSATPLMASPASIMSYEPLCHQYKAMQRPTQSAGHARNHSTTNNHRSASNMNESPIRRRKELAEKPPPKIDEMNKTQLINAMMNEHSLVSLPVGTVNANTKRAAAAAAITTNTNQFPLSDSNSNSNNNNQTSLPAFWILSGTFARRRDMYKSF
ncbi:hypothetical protein K457DRAFT_26007 [Linnemannia elongata AG-77]|uniref:Uncharacterized protein n=1 Tax=Linnemannia elongata AG-77 TaxID=1314771 RepID=A0A197JBW1_9FUNG|nr:hypothetical protein K457DRAFT_26007 [Linnemannia elongata AG-77]